MWTESIEVLNRKERGTMERNGCVSSIPKSEEFKERSEGHRELWECTLEEFAEKVLPVLKSIVTKNSISKRVYTTATNMLRVKFQNGSLAGTVDYEVSTALDYAFIYHVNVMGENV